MGMTACKTTGNQQLSRLEEDSVMVSDRVQEGNKQPAMEQLIDLYEAVDAFPITVSTQKGDRHPDSLAAVYQGREIAESLLAVFDSLILYNAGEERTQVYATRRFNISANTIGLLTRVPGPYWSSKIDLFLLDTKAGKILDHYEVAETWGDAGESLLKESIIEKSAPDQLTIRTTKAWCWPTDDTLEKIACVDSLLTSKVSDKRIQTIEKKRLRSR